jgi:hypothetical protein
LTLAATPGEHKSQDAGNWRGRRRSNLWPEPLDAATAQQAIADDWTEAFARFVRPPGEFFPPAAGAMTPR